MQLVSLASAAPLFILAQAAPAANPAGSEVGRAMLQVLRENAGPLLLWLAAMQVVTILAYWIASKFVAGDEDTATFGNAFKVYLSYLVLSVAMVIGAALALPALAIAIRNFTGQGGSAAGGLGAALLGGGILLLFLGLIFVIPMRVYRIGFWRAFGFLVLTAVLGALGNFGLGFAFGNVDRRVAERLAAIAATGPQRPGGGLLGELAARQARDAAFDAQERIAMDSSRTFNERQAALKELYAQLEQIRASVAPGDAAARAAYDQRKARYESLLNRVKAEYAAQRGGR